MKIVKMGEIPKEKVFNARCGYCQTEIEFIMADVKREDKFFLFVDCPLCKQEMQVGVDSGVMKPIKRGEHNKIVSYILANWDSLPKSTFNGDECVIFDEVYRSDSGWGNHSYEGYGVDFEGNIVRGSSSGCSCNGSCCMEPFSVELNKEQDLKFDNYNPELINFDSLQVDFSDY